MNVFGGSGASAFLKKATQILGLLFVVSCLSLAFLVRGINTSKVSTIQARQKKLAEQAGGTKSAAPAKAPVKAPAAVPAQTPKTTK